VRSLHEEISWQVDYVRLDDGRYRVAVHGLASDAVRAVTVAIRSPGGEAFHDTVIGKNAFFLELLDPTDPPNSLAALVVAEEASIHRIELDM
jgi:hypothetical protein